MSHTYIHTHTFCYNSMLHLHFVTTLLCQIRTLLQFYVIHAFCYNSTLQMHFVTTLCHICTFLQLYVTYTFSYKSISHNHCVTNLSHISLYYNSVSFIHCHNSMSLAHFVKTGSGISCSPHQLLMRRPNYTCLYSD